MARSPVFDADAVVRAQEGDEEARTTLLQQIEPILKAFFINRIGRRAEVDDLIQNTLLRVHGGLKDLKNPARLKSFTMKAAVFELQDYYRGRYSAKERLFAPDVPPVQPEETASAGAGFDVERALSALTPKVRRIIELREYGYRYAEIAEEIGTTEAAIKMQVKRAFEKMRNALVTIAVVVLWSSCYF